MSSKTINTRFQMRRDTAANWTSTNPVLLAGELGFESDTRKMKFGVWNGTDTVAYDPNGNETAKASTKKSWSQLEYAGADEEQIKELINAAEDNVKAVVLGADETDAEACARAYEVDNDSTEAKGDMCVVKKLISNDKYSYTAYVYDGTSWEAMDGNYNAENVYFAEDLTYTKAIGELAAVGSSGSATLSAAGKSVKEVLASILAKKAQPSKTDPSVSISGNQSSESLEVGSAVSKSGTMSASLSAGSYTYGPSTGVTASAWETKVKYQGGDDIATGTASSLAYSYNFTLGESEVKVDYYAKATHGEGAIAKDNLGGNSDPVKRVAAGTKDKTVTVTYTPFRYWYIGGLNSTTALDSTAIKSLTKKASGSGINGEYKASSYNSGTIKRFVIAIPHSASKNVTSVLLKSASNADITGEFKKQSSTVSVAGASAGYDADYDVWIYQPAALDSSEVYTITIG